MRRPSAAGSSISAAAVCLTIAFVAFFAVVALFATATNAQRREHAAELRATKGQLFVHMLHSAYFFPQTVDVKWSVSTRGRPSLPHWLHLFPSRHRSIAFLVGTPVSPHSHFAIHVIARRLDSFQSAEQSFSIVTNDDPRFNGSVQEIAEIKLTNVDAEDLIWGIGRDGKLKSLERAIHSTFRGKNVGPFIFNILPGIANPPPPEFFHQLRRRINTGTILQVGTQRHFHPNVQQLARGLQLNPDFCVQHNLIPIDRHFRAEQLVVDWCKFHLRNVTLLKELGEQQQQQQETMAGKKPLGNVVKAGPDGTFVVRSSAENETAAATAAVAGGSGTANQLVGRQQQQPMPAPPVYYIWESVLVFPLLACLCLLCILCLSFIFFGRREGQHWRDFKTPKQQLEQYLNLRESQRHLREMSQQRQMQAMSRSVGEQNNDRVSIGTFLRPRDDNKRDSQQSQSLVLRHKPEFASRGTLASSTLGGGGRSSIGKQTVAEAARANGSALHLYRHPPAESDEDREASEDEQEAEEGRGSRAMEPVKDSRQWR